MYSARFLKAFEKIIYHEGGYVNHPSDPGGATKYGISKHSYPNLDIKKHHSGSSAANLLLRFLDQGKIRENYR